MFMSLSLHGFKSLLFPLSSLQLRNKVLVVASEDLEKFRFPGGTPGRGAGSVAGLSSIMPSDAAPAARWLAVAA